MKIDPERVSTIAATIHAGAIRLMVKRDYLSPSDAAEQSYTAYMRVMELLAEVLETVEQRSS